MQEKSKVQHQQTKWYFKHETILYTRMCIHVHKQAISQYGKQVKSWKKKSAMIIYTTITKATTTTKIHKYMCICTALTQNHLQKQKTDSKTKNMRYFIS